MDDESIAKQFPSGVILETKQEKFLQLVFGGMAKYKAYREAYPGAGEATDRRVSIRAAKLLNQPNVRARWKEMRDLVFAPIIADVTEREAYWTGTMRDEAEETKDRLRASELLGKKQGDFIERVESRNFNINATLSRLDTLSDEQIEELLGMLAERKAKTVDS